MTNVELETMTCAEAADRIERAANADRLVQANWHSGTTGSEPFGNGEMGEGQQGCLVGSIHFRIRSTRNVKHLAPIWFFDLAVCLFDCLPESRMKECALHFASVLRTLDGRDEGWWNEHRVQSEVHGLLTAHRACAPWHTEESSAEIVQLITSVEACLKRGKGELLVGGVPDRPGGVLNKMWDLCYQAMERIKFPLTGRGEFSSLWYAQFFQYIAIYGVGFTVECTAYPCWSRLADRTRMRHFKPGASTGPQADQLDDYVVAQWKDVWNQFLKAPVAPEEKPLGPELDSPGRPDEVAVAG